MLFFANMLLRSGLVVDVAARDESHAGTVGVILMSVKTWIILGHLAGIFYDGS